jgi:NADPH:quinone reductase-like Zn-dependent oxidoreductase
LLLEITEPAMLALVLTKTREALQLEDRPPLVAGAGEAVVDLKAAALNRRDYWIWQGMYPAIRTPAVLGSDGAGVVSSAGEGADEAWLGRDVIVNPGWDWGDRPEAQSERFRILGMPDDGTFAAQVVVPAAMLHARPEHLTWHEAAALPLAGLTAYRALFVQGRLAAGMRVLVTGIGGGVASIALKLAVAAGASVCVTSSAKEKIATAVEHGAAAGYDYTADDWHRRLTDEHGPVDLTIDSAGGPGYARLIDIAAPGGRIVHYGATRGPAESVDLFKVFWNQLHLIGSTMGSPADFAAMLDFVTRTKVRPAIDRVVPLAEGNAALASMKDSPQFGKIVLETAAP